MKISKILLAIALLSSLNIKAKQQVTKSELETRGINPIGESKGTFELVMEDKKEPSAGAKLLKQILRLSVAIGTYQMVNKENLAKALKTMIAKKEDICPEILDGAYEWVIKVVKKGYVNVDEIIVGKAIKSGSALAAYVITDFEWDDILNTLQLPLQVLNSARVLAGGAIAYGAFSHYHNTLEKKRLEIESNLQ